MSEHSAHLGSDSEVLHLAYFFVPLTEPLAVPDQSVVEFREPWTTRDWIASAEAGHCRDFSPELIKRFASLRFWQTDTADAGMLGLGPALEVATRAFPNLPEPEAASAVPRPVTVVEAAIQLCPYEGDDPPDEVIDEAFGAVLDCVRTVQRAYSLVLRRPVVMVTRERMPPLVPMACRLGLRPGDSSPWPEDVSLLGVNTNVHHAVREEPLDQDTLDNLSAAMDHLHPGVAFSRYPDLVREAIVAHRRSGDYMAAVVLAATAAEVLLDDLLMHLLWEEAYRPEDAAAMFVQRDNLVSRIKVDYHDRLGGTWQLDQPGPLQDWHKNLAGVRNRIVHAGYEPTSEEVDAAHDALFGLEDFLKGQLTQDQRLRRYPRTALAVAAQNLAADGRLSKRLTNLMDDPAEPGWRETFGRWRSIHAQCRAEGIGWREEPSLGRAKCVAVVETDGAVTWWLHDLETQRVCAARQPRLPAEVESTPEQLVGRGWHEASERQSIVFPGVTAEPVEPPEWIYQYRVLPFAGVMVDRSDFDGR